MDSLGGRCGGCGVAAAVVAGRCWLRCAAYDEFFNGSEGLTSWRLVQIHSTRAHFGGDSSGDQGDSTGAGVRAHRGADLRSWPQVVEEILQAIQVIPQVRVSERIVEQIFDVPVLPVLEEIGFRRSWRRSLRFSR